MGIAGLSDIFGGAGTSVGKMVFLFGPVGVGAAATFFDGLMTFIGFELIIGASAGAPFGPKLKYECDDV